MLTIDLHVGDQGLPFEISIVEDDGTTPLDLSRAVSLDLMFQKPDGSLVVKPGVFVNNNDHGVIRYYFVAGDLDQPDMWRFQLRITMDDDTIKYSEITKFKVYGNLPLEL